VGPADLLEGKLSQSRQIVTALSFQTNIIAIRALKGNNEFTQLISLCKNQSPILF